MQKTDEEKRFGESQVRMWLDIEKVWVLWIGLQKTRFSPTRSIGLFAKNHWKIWV